jgi:hypothetical protein
MLAELGQVPAGAAEDADLWFRQVGISRRVEFAVHGADQGGFAAAVGAEDGDVFAGLDGQVDVVEDDAVAQGYVDVAHLEKWVRGWGRLACLWAGGSGVLCHLIC